MRELEIDGHRLNIEEEWAWDNEAGAVVWDAALVLAYYLSARPELVRGRRVLELGTGPGAANGLSSIATAVPLRWGDALPPAEQLPGQPLEVVLASDVLYQAEALPLFIRTLCQVFAANPEACLILCIEHRPALPFPAALFAAAGLRGRRLPTAEQHPEWRSDDIHLFCIQLAAAASGGHGQQQAASGSSNDSDR
ncbi:hypothetical protein ABPG75_012566 [Micractinium tetrahymenae]